jgi:hypothetical protein
MDKRLGIVLVILAGGIYWTMSHRSPAPPASSPSSGSGSTTLASNGLDCVQRAEVANQKLHEAGMLLLHPPVDANAWSSAESDVSSAISSADSACGSGNTEADRKAAEEVRAALGMMRSTLGSLSGAARGAGGATEGARDQEQIDAHIQKARGFLRS